MTEYEKRQLKKRIARFVIAAVALAVFPLLAPIWGALDYAYYGRLKNTVEIWELIRVNLFFGKSKVKTN